MTDLVERLRNRARRLSQPSGDAPPRRPGPRRRLAERSEDRYLGGVAGGIAQALDTDPLLVRVGLALLALYVPAIIAVYTLAWVFMPDARTGRSLVAAARDPGDWRGLLGVLALGIGALFVVPDIGPGGNGALTAGVLLLVTGFLLVTTQRRDAVAGSPDVAAPGAADGQPAPPAPPSAGPPGDAPPAPAPAPAREPRPPSYLGWLGLSALVVLVGVMAAVDRGVDPVKPGVAVSAGLVLVGAVLVLGAWRGRARLLMFVGLLLVPLWIGWSLSDVPRFDNDGDANYEVGAQESLPQAFEHGYGTMDVDLSEVDLAEGERRSVRIGLTAGRVRIDIPRQVHLDITGDLGFGRVEVWDDEYSLRVADSETLLAQDVDLHEGDPDELCARQRVYDYPTDRNADYPPEIADEPSSRLEYRTPWGEPCTPPEPPPDNPARVELVLDVGIGNVEVHRV